MQNRVSAIVKVVSLLATIAVLAAGCSFGGGDDDDDTTARTDEPVESTTTVEERELEEGDVNPTRLELQEIDDSGVRGTARIEPASDEGLDIEITLEDDDSGPHGVEARMGSCDDAVDGSVTDEVIGEAASYTLADIEDGSMRDTAKLPDDIVKSGTYSLLVYDGPDVDGDIAACVDVEVD